ncbi:MAG: SDR family NAD(P)-dependent oxidoreductase [Dehalococcoidia bacterium]|nr:SDR family NAD(P)-dependent oxidoreductase [Dehalococcoidia bacterium]
MRLKDKVAVITGGGRGIGRAVALAFVREGAKAVVSDVNLEPAQEVANEIAAQGGQALALQTDVSKRAEVRDMVDAALKRFGQIDILVNNAGNFNGAMLHKMTEEQWDSVVDVHLKGAFLCTQAVASHMIERKTGRIINVTAFAGERGNLGCINYAAAKAGIIGVTKAAAKELARFQINVNCVAPGLTHTRMSEILFTDQKFHDMYMKEIPLARFVEPEEVANAFLFFASPDSSYITGQVLRIDGGLCI